MRRPETTEYAEFYAGYVLKVPETDIVRVLGSQPDEMRQTLAGITDERGGSTYAEGKWTIKELLGHLNDGERVFSYRAFRISRGDSTPLPGFEQDLYVANGRANERPIAELLDEFDLLRRGTMLIFGRLQDDDWLRSGTASDAHVTVRGLAYILAGHVRHHMGVLKDRYLK